MRGGEGKEGEGRVRKVRGREGEEGEGRVRKVRGG